MFAIAFLFSITGKAGKLIPDFIITIPATDISISVIIPARNEENNIRQLLEALQQQTYPAGLTEIIVVDDHSTDPDSQYRPPIFICKTGPINRREYQLV